MPTTMLPNRLLAAAPAALALALWPCLGSALSLGPAAIVSHRDGDPMTTASHGAAFGAVSADGEWLLFTSHSTDLVPGQLDPTPFSPDVFLRRLGTGETRLVSRIAPGQAASEQSLGIALSADGRFALIESTSTGLIPGFIDGNGPNHPDLFLYDRDTDSFVLVTRSHLSPLRSATNSHSSRRLLAADGSAVLFEISGPTDLVGGYVDDPFSDRAIFRFDRLTGTVRLVSRAHHSLVQEANGRSTAIGLSADGRYALFESEASNLIAGLSDTNGVGDAFLYDAVTDSLKLLSHLPAQPMVAGPGASALAISEDAQWVFLRFAAGSLMPGISDPAGAGLVVAQRRSDGHRVLLNRSVAQANAAANAPVFLQGASADGRLVLATSMATDLVAGIADAGHLDVFVLDRDGGPTRLVSKAHGAAQSANGPSGAFARISADGRFVLFASQATDLVPGWSGPMGGEHLFLSDVTGEVALVDHVHGAPSQPATAPVIDGLLPRAAALVLFRTIEPAGVFVPGASDPNSAIVGYRGDWFRRGFAAPDPSRIFADGFEG
ncbi:MAG: hypothetical protein RML12_09550 [Xanthomonadales bacterium]|nr:hypothetical protein [Xanthomonadales bacterium]